MAVVRVARERSLSLAVGAGVSASAGLPSWPELLRRIGRTYFNHWTFEQRDLEAAPTIESVVFTSRFAFEGTGETADQLSMGTDPLQMAQMIKARIRRKRDWNYLVRKALYDFNWQPAPSPLLWHLADLVRECGVEVVLDYNYDDLVEISLDGRNVPNISVWEPVIPQRPGKVTVHHVHGLMKYGGGPVADIVLAEQDYHGYASRPFGWQNVIQLALFTQTTCVFVGFSMTDPHVRRLLWAAHQAGAHRHYVFLPTSTLASGSEQRMLSVFDRSLLDFGVAPIRFPAGPTGKDYRRLPSLIRLLKEASRDPDSMWRGGSAP